MRAKTICLAVAAAMAASLLVTYAANELTAGVTFQVAKGYLTYSRAVSATWTITNATPNVAADSVNLTTGSVTAVGSGSVAVKGWAWFRNLSTNNTASLGVYDANTNYVEFARLKPGEYGLIRLGENPIQARLVSDVTNETTSVLEKAIIDD